jgi:hypothetical protein
MSQRQDFPITCARSLTTRQVARIIRCEARGTGPRRSIQENPTCRNDTRNPPIRPTASTSDSCREPAWTASTASRSVRNGPRAGRAAEAFVGFAQSLRDALFALQQPGDDEIDRESVAANALVARYAVCCREQRTAGLSRDDVRAIGVHGQTVRHRPERGYTRQLNNPALLAELTHVDVIADFRMRDVAAGGHGAGAGVSCDGVRRAGRHARRLQPRRHQQHHDPAG